MNIREALSTIEIFKNAGKDSLEELESGATVKRLGKGEYLFRDKESVRNVYCVLNGMVSLHKFNGDGDKKIIFVYGKGKVLNEVILNNLPASVNCEAVQDSLILSIPQSLLLKVMAKDFDLTKAIIDSMSIKIRRLYRQMKNTSNSIRGDKKLAAKLWKLSHDYGELCKNGSHIKIDITVTFLADMLGSKRETVSRQLKLLKDLGLVIYKNQRFIIPDREKLRDYFKSP